MALFLYTPLSSELCSGVSERIKSGYNLYGSKDSHFRTCYVVYQVPAVLIIRMVVPKRRYCVVLEALLRGPSILPGFSTGYRMFRGHGSLIDEKYLGELRQHCVK
jgi:hypothetical protein